MRWLFRFLQGINAAARRLSQALASNRSAAAAAGPSLPVAEPSADAVEAAEAAAAALLAVSAAGAVSAQKMQTLDGFLVNEQAATLAVSLQMKHVISKLANKCR